MWLQTSPSFSHPSPQWTGPLDSLSSLVDAPAAQRHISMTVEFKNYVLDPTFPQGINKESESLRLQLNLQLNLFCYLVVEDFNLVLVQAMLTVVGLHGSA